MKIDVEEVYPPTLERGNVALYLSKLKAAGYTGELGNNILLTADTIVCLGDEVIGKPKDEEDACRMLAHLSGRMHEVFTAVTLTSARGAHSFIERSEVYFKPFSAEEIRYYVTNYKPLDKAGAYGIQDWLGYVGIERINGCFYNVMGLPVSRLYDELKAYLG